MMRTGRRSTTPAGRRVQGNWNTSSRWNWILDPLNGDRFINVADTQEAEINPFVESLLKCPKYGLHNPLRAQDRYVMYGDISAKAARVLAQPEVAIIIPFNFPLEIPLLQLMGALYMGNKPILKVDSKAKPQMPLFTGSSRVAEKITVDLKGRVKLEDVGFDWKILGPDVQEVSLGLFVLPHRGQGYLRIDLFCCLGVRSGCLCL